MRTERVGGNVLLGTLLALVFVARLDTVFIAVAFMVAQVVVHARAGRGVAALKPAIVTGITFTIVNAPYLMANLVYYGNIVPVSGIKKTEGAGNLVTNLFASASNMIAAVVDKLHVPTVVFVVAVVAMTAVMLWMCLTPKCRPTVTAAAKGGVLPAFAVGVVVRALYLALFVPEYTQVSWYWVPESVLLSVVAAVSASAVVGFFGWEWAERRLVLGATAAVLFVAGSLHQLRDAEIYQEAIGIRYEAALWAGENTPAEKLFAMVDSGVFAYFSNRDVIPLNGLITNRTTMERIREGKFRDVLDEFDVDYLVQYIDQATDPPPHAVIYQSKTVPNGQRKGKRLTILDYKAFPEETAEFLPVSAK